MVSESLNEEEITMAIKQVIIKGGSFLIDDIASEQVFTPEDFTDEQKMIAKTTEDFVEKEVLPQVEHLENHEFDRSR